MKKIYESKKEKRRAHYLRHRDHVISKSRAWRAANKEKMKEGNRKIQLRRFYGMSLEDFDRLWDAQSGACAICSEVLVKGKKTCVDHDHSSGKVRGLLCQSCNTGLGRFRDNVVSLANAIAYLSRDRAVIS